MLYFLKTDFKIIFCAAALLLLLPSYGPAGQQISYKGTITAHKLNIRSRPSRSSDVVVVVEKGDVVDVLGKKGRVGSWLKVLYNGKQGYIRNRLKYVQLKPVQKPSAGLKIKKVEAKPQSIPKKVEEKSQKISKKAQKKEIEENIIKQEKLVENFSQKEVEIIEGLNEIDYALNKARVKVTALSTELEQLEAKIGSLSAEQEKLVRAIQVNKAYTGKRLKAIYKMNMIGRLDAAGLPSSLFDFFLKQNAMKKIIASDFNVLEEQGADLNDLKQVQAELKKEIESKIHLESELKDQIRINKKETLKRELILKEIRKKKKLSLAAVEALKNAAVQLDNRINNLDAGQDGNLNQSMFSSYKGRLILPVRGKIISRYGPKQTPSNGYKAFTFQKGIDIKAERGEPVKSVFKGVVMFAEWLKGYGNLLIINHGDNYYTLYAHVEEIFKQQGEHVDTGEVIATAGDTGSIKGMCLHFELRHHGKPVNPMKWLRKGA